MASIQDRIEDPQKIAQGGVVVPIMSFWADRDDECPRWGTPLTRAVYLDGVWRNDSRLSGVLHTMVSRMGANGWSISGPVDDLKTWYRVFAYADDGWTDFVRLGYTDYLTTDEGFVQEVSRAWYPDGPVLNLYHLDARRCVPGPVQIGGQIYPLLFQDVTAWKGLQPGQFNRMCSLPATDQFRRRMGFCFISRVLRFARWADEIMKYQEEKVGNLPPEGIATVTGLTKPQVENAFKEYDQARKQKEMLVFPGILWFVANTYGQEASVTFTSFRDVWQGFSDREVNEMFMKVVALDAGVDVGEFWQVEFHGATKAASWLQHQKSWGKGPAEFIVAFERFAASFLPFGYNWAFDVPDDEQDLLTARIQGQEIRNVKDMYATSGEQEGLISKEEAREMLAQKGIIPQRYVQPPERVATDVLREVTGKTVGTVRWPEGQIEVHHRWWSIEANVLPPKVFQSTQPSDAETERICNLLEEQYPNRGIGDTIRYELCVVRKDWEVVMRLLQAILEAISDRFIDSGISLVYKSPDEVLELLGNLGNNDINKKAKPTFLLPEAVLKDWDILTALFRVILSKWSADIKVKLETDDPALDQDAYWQSWGQEIRDAVFSDFFTASLDGIWEADLGISFVQSNDIARQVAQERAFDLVRLDGDESIVRSTRDALDRIRERLATGELAWVDLSAALEPLFGAKRAEKIAVSENTDLWAEAQLRTAEEAGIAEKRSVRADVGRPCPTNICDDAEKAGWVPLDAEIVPGYQRPKYHPNCFCLLKFQ